MSATGQRVTIRSRVRIVPRAVWLVLAVALVLRVAWVIYAAREPANFGDPFIYLQLARRVADGNGYGPWFSTGSPTAFHPVGYPGSLAGIVWAAKLVGLQHDEPLIIGLIQALLGTASVALVYAISVRLWGSRVALIAAALTAGFPSLIIYTALVYSETLYLFGVLLSIWLIVRADWKPVPALPALITFGIVVGLSSLVRPFAMLSLIPLGAAALRAGASLRAMAKTVGIVAGIAVLVLVPWTIRNAFAFHAFVPVSTNLGDTLCLDNSPGAYGGFRELPPECSPQVPNGRYEAKRNSHDLHYAVSWAVHHPGREAVLVFRRAFYGYRGDGDVVGNLTGDRGQTPAAWLRPPLRHFADVYYFAVLLLALPGFWLFGGDPRHLLVLLVAASLAIVPLFLYGLPRFHVPLLPFLAMAAALTVNAFLRARTLRDERAQA